ncbi:uncharacterized protein EAE98_008437 [Botrytis deweyae]|uniref:Uncharacterized protein n=1 Tax=Botrytis deweyae TaxID=2478750 RepID=A0ABQ7IE82_9HELO|nr:uncharacterized protein EAE98_008437 [Botrytis deweyae]KAF7921590.1 hypothetical protein EAE98_008437 [Botrytis deweyae]
MTGYHKQLLAGALPSTLKCIANSQGELHDMLHHIVHNTKELSNVPGIKQREAARLEGDYQK